MSSDIFGGGIQDIALDHENEISEHVNPLRMDGIASQAFGGPSTCYLTFTAWVRICCPIRGPKRFGTALSFVRRITVTWALQWSTISWGQPKQQIRTFSARAMRQVTSEAATAIRSGTVLPLKYHYHFFQSLLLCSF